MPSYALPSARYDLAALVWPSLEDVETGHANGYGGQKIYMIGGATGSKNVSATAGAAMTPIYDCYAVSNHSGGLGGGDDGHVGGGSDDGLAGAAAFFQLLG